MKLSKRQKAIVYGLVLGDAYLQKTGKANARLRLEHSLNQQAYIDWKYSELRNLFQSTPKPVTRIHPKSKRTHQYLRLQSHASPLFGRIRRMFYDYESGKKRIPQNIAALISNPLTLAVWYMDDGYYDRRDKSAHIYLQRFKPSELERLVQAIKEQHGLGAKWYCRPDRKSCQLNFTGQQKDNFIALIRPYLIDEMRHKLPS